MVVFTVFEVVLLLLLAGPCVYCQQPCDENAGCFPSLGNLAIGRSVQASSTCMSSFCTGFTNDMMSCNNSQYQSASINDNNTNTFWVSRVGSQLVLPITLQLDFEGSVLFDSMTMVWQSSRPAAMILERSNDNGDTWTPYQYYSSDCMADYNLTNSVITPMTTFTGPAAICTSQESTLSGMVTFTTSSHVVEDMIEYRTITNLRVQLIRLNVNVLLNDECHQNFAVSEWNVQGTCMCNGHAGTCAPLPQESVASGKVYAGCMCMHNTDGEQCDECVVGFNNMPWREGNETDANVCEACQCFSHAEDCVYEESMMSAVCINCTDNTSGPNCNQCLPSYYPNSSLLISDPQYCTSCECDSAGAINGNCDNSGQCTCKTAVDSSTLTCSECRDGFWNLSNVNPLGCTECECNLDGTQLAGNITMCNKTDGVCQCKNANIIGSRCDQCQDGFYSLTDGCSRSCNCDPVGSTGQMCNIVTGQCYCKPNITGLMCNSPVPGSYYRSLDAALLEAEEAIFTPSFTREFTPPNTPVGLFTGTGFVSTSTAGNITFILTVPKSSQYEILLRYRTSSAVTGVSITIRSLAPVSRSLQCANQSSQLTTYESPGYVTLPGSGNTNTREHCFDSLCLDQAVSYELTVLYDPMGVNRLIDIDSVVARPDFRVISDYYQSLSPLDRILADLSLSQTLLPNPDPNTLTDFFRFSVEFYGQVFECPVPSLTGVMNSTSVCDTNRGQYMCRDGFTGLLCDQCQNGYYNETDCRACGCNVTGSQSEVCNHQTGQCSCRPGVGDLQCTSCLPEHYNFSSEGCSSCECSQYALSEVCSETGQCSCPAGVGGLTCNQCNDEFFNISATGCQPCDCNPQRSLSNVCNKTTGQCSCTGDATGLNCVSCPENHFETDGLLQPGCVRCVCSGFSQECSADNTSTILGAVETPFNILCGINPASCSSGWQILNQDGTNAAPFGPSDNGGLGYILVNGINPMLNAPAQFLGDQRRSYQLMFEVTVIKSESATFRPVGSKQVILEGSRFPMPLVGLFSGPVSASPDASTFSISMNETQWRVGSADGTVSTLQEFLSVISNITRLRFTAKFTEDLIEFIRIENVRLNIKLSLEEAMQDNITGPVLTVEDCECPLGRIGLSCDECDVGYYRPSGSPGDPCLPCLCNGQAETCDQTGVCINCGGNTTGDDCGTCLPGYYGNVTIGVSCQPCLCPLLNQSFSPTCYLDPSDDMNHTCDQCETGYDGNHCNVCENGYFGNPLVENGICNDCTCNNNVDPALGPTCDMTNGNCLNCQNNTNGTACQFCKRGFYGDIAKNEACRDCECNLNGTREEICDILVGTCFCVPNVTGDKCDRCEPGFYGDPVNNVECRPCECPGSGLTLSPTCVLDSDNGFTCDNCTAGYGGRRCELCADGYFRNMEGNCQRCDCNGNVEPSLGVPTCNMTTGQCFNCLNNTEGFNCQFCKTGFYGDVTNGQPCQPCNCNLDGATDQVCDILSGACHCLPNVVNGGDCGVCEPGFWNLTAGVGCVPCDCCTNGSQSSACNQVTGDCECQPGVGGSDDNKCCQCSHGFFNFTSTGCQDCGCSELSSSPQCSDTGVCDCINGGFGPKCNECERGYFGRAPNCTRCHDCYFHWSDILEDTNENITFLMNQIEQVLQYYNGFDISDIERTIVEVQETVAQINMSLSAIMPDESVPNTIRMILSEINAACNDLITQVEDIRNNLITSEQLLMNITRFMTELQNSSSGVFPVPIQSIYTDIKMLNMTIHQLEETANASYSQIQLHYDKAVNATTTVENILSQADQALVVILDANVTTADANSIVSNFTSLAMNYSQFDVGLKMIQQWIYFIQNETDNVDINAEDLSSDTDELDSRLNAINSTLMRLANMTRTLTSSTQQVMIAANQQLEATKNLSVMASEALASALTLLNMVETASDELANTSSTLRTTREVAENLMSIPSLPTAEALSTATAINETVVPESVLEEIQADAQNSSSIANSTLSRAEEAKMAVKMLNLTINELASNVNSTQAALTQCTNNTNTIAEQVNTISDTLEEVEKTTTNVAQHASEAEANFKTANRSVNEAKDIEQSVEDTVNQLLDTATTVHNETQSANQVLQDVKTNQTSLHESVSSLHSQAQEITQRAGVSLSRAKALNATEAARFQRLKDLIGNYTTKQQMVNQLRANITALRNELQGMTARFRDTAERYKRCYKTP